MIYICNTLKLCDWFKLFIINYVKPSITVFSFNIRVSGKLLKCSFVFNFNIFLRNTCRALFERHKLLLSFHIVSRILFQQGKMSMQEYLFLLKGGVVLDRSEQPDNPTSQYYIYYYYSTSFSALCSDRVRCSRRSTRSF